MASMCILHTYLQETLYTSKIFSENHIMMYLTD